MEVADEVKDEIEALKSIFGEDYTELPVSWSDLDENADIWGNPAFSIRIKPLAISLDRRFTQAELKFSLVKGYPHEVPRIEYLSYNGLSSSEFENLQFLVNEKAHEEAKRGEVMIHVLCSVVEEYLSDQNKDSSTPKSLFEISKKREQSEKDSLQRLRQEMATDECTGNYYKTSGERRQQQLTGSGENAMPTQDVSLWDRSDNADVSVDLFSLVRKSLQINLDDDDDDVHSTFDDGDREEEEDGSNVKDDDERKENFSSRYCKEFVELELLGKGASGQVWKARNRLDRRVYAVKKILLDRQSKEVDRKIRREVTTISRLLHKNIVRYYAAWLEEFEEVMQDDESAKAGTMSFARVDSYDFSSKHTSSHSTLLRKEGESTSSSDDDDDNHNDCFEFDSYSYSFDGAQSSYSDESSDVNYTKVKSDNSDLLNEIDINNIHKNNPLYQQINTKWMKNSKSSSNTSDNEDNSKSNDHEGVRVMKCRALYIQMEFCHMTLRSLIASGQLWKRPIEIMALFRQTVEAMHYMHSCGVIHRDLKPDNIFIDSEGIIKIGDFGLATSEHSDVLLRTSSSVDYSVSSSGKFDKEDVSKSDLTEGVGTALYRAPEQGGDISTTHQSYDSRADLFSVGVILFEMCHEPFSTGMERNVMIRALREKNELSADFIERVGEKVSKVIQILTSKSPQDRPTAEELLVEHLPTRFEGDFKYSQELSDALATPNSNASKAVANILFSQTGSRVSEEDDFNFDRDALMLQTALIKPRVGISSKGYGGKGRKFTDLNLLPIQISVSITKLLEEVFELFGAVKFGSLMFAPYSNGGSANNALSANTHSNSIKGTAKTQTALNRLDAQVFYDAGGMVVALPSDLITPYARQVARLGLTTTHRYNIDKVFRRRTRKSINAMDINESLDESLYPRELNEAVFDIVRDSGRRIGTEASIISSSRNQKNTDDKDQQLSGNTFTATSEIRDSVITKVQAEVLSVGIMLSKRLNAILSVRDTTQSIHMNEDNFIVIRFGHSKLGESILDLCQINSTYAKHSVYLTISKVIPKLIYELYCTEVSSAASLSEIINEVLNDIESTVGDAEMKALRPFLNILFKRQQDEIFIVLKELEEEFYRNELITKLQRQLAMSTTSISSSLPVQGSVLGPKDVKRIRLAVRDFDNSIRELRSLFALVVPSIQHGASAQQKVAPVFLLDITNPVKTSTSPFGSGFGYRLMVLRRDVDGILFPLSSTTSTSPTKSGKQHTPLLSFDVKVLGESGRFDQLIYSFRPPNLISHSDGLVACGLRVFMDSILALLVDFISNGYAGLRSLSHTPLMAYASIPKVVVYILNNEQSIDESTSGLELDKLAMSAIGQLRSVGISASLGKHELQSRLVTQATRKNFLKSRVGTYPSANTSSGIHQTALQFLATTSIQSGIGCIFVIHNSPSEPKRTCILGCRLNYPTPTHADTSLTVNVGSSNVPSYNDMGRQFEYTALLQSELVPFVLHDTKETGGYLGDLPVVSGPIGGGNRQQRRSISDTSTDEEYIGVEKAMGSNGGNASSNDDVSGEPSAGSMSGSTANNVNIGTREFVFFADKSVTTATSGKHKFKELRFLEDKIKSQYLQYYGGTAASLPLIISTELGLIELRDLGTFLIRLCSNNNDSLSSSSSKGSSSLNSSSVLTNEVDNYTTNRINQRAIKNFIAEMSRVHNGSSGSSMKKVTAYSLQDEKFDQFFIPTITLQKLRDHVVKR